MNIKSNFELIVPFDYSNLENMINVGEKCVKC